MAARRALLIGVEHYDHNFGPIGAVPSDLSMMEKALCASGYKMAKPCVDPNRSRMLSAVTDFLHAAKAGDTLVIYFTGHGVYHDGSAYLVARDSSLLYQDGQPRHPRYLANFLLSTREFDAAVESCPADTIVFLIDACLEGIHFYREACKKSGHGTKGSFEVGPWSNYERRETARRFVVYVYSCPPGSKSGYIHCPEQGMSYSFFTRAISEVLDPGCDARQYDEVIAATKIRLEDVTRQHNAGAQEIHCVVAGPAGGERRVICEGSVPSDDPWLTTVERSGLWKDPPSGPEDGYKKACRNLVARCRKEYLAAKRRFPDDPWLDEQFPVRVVQRLEVLVNRCREHLEPLHLAERALLLCAPFVREGVLASARLTAMGDPAAIDHTWEGVLPRALHVIRESMPQIVRKAERLRDRQQTNEHRAVAAWLLHRAFLQAAEVWISDGDRGLPQAILNDLPLPSDTNTALGAAFSLDRLKRLAQCVHGDPERLERSQPVFASSATLPFEGGHNPRIREQVVGALLCLAGWQAIDARALDPVLIDHVGLSEGLALEPALTVGTLRRSCWEESAGKMTLQLSNCPHAAIDLALRRHLELAERCLRHLLDRIDRKECGLDVLDALPRLLGKELWPDEENGLPIYDPSRHVVFRLAQSEVRELFMGERLYGDPTLAIRELYQNALDACRYREARLDYLDRTSSRPGQCLASQWQARIEFVQGTDENGRPYIECRDTGIGMDCRTVEECFAQAGRRFTDTTEFLEEQARWLQIEPPVEFYPNSQFGIGVFSYFMLADELHLRTRRLDATGRPGRTVLDVRVSGSGSLFHIRAIDDPYAEPRDAGTTVRLLLNRTSYADAEGDTKRISCFETLNRLLYIAEFPTSVQEDNHRAEWKPYELRLPDPKVSFVRGRDADCWWLSKESGRVLCDGVATEQEEKFAVVNLARQFRPELTVDRRNLRSMDQDHFRALKLRSLTSLVPAPDWLSFDWLWAFCDAQEFLAEPLGKLLISASLSLPVDNSSRSCEILARRTRGLQVSREDRFPVAIVGIVAFDREVLDRDVSTVRRCGLLSPGLTLRIGIWRLSSGLGTTAFLATARQSLSAYFGMIAGFQSDRRVLSRDLDGERPWLEGRVTLGHLLRAAQQLRESPRAVYERLARWAKVFELELPAVDPATLDNLTWDEDDRTVLSRDLDGERPWLEGRVTAGHLLRAAEELRESPRAVYERLARWAKVFELELPAVDPATLDSVTWDEKDLTVLSRDLDGERPWLEGRVTLGHLLRAAQQLRESPRAVYERLARWAKVFELELPAVDPATLDNLTWDEDDRTVLSRDLDGERPWLEGRVTAGHLLRAAEELRESPRAVYERLARWAKVFELELPAVDPATLDSVTWDEKDLTVLSHGLDGDETWLEGRVILGHLLRAAEEFRESPRAVYERLARWAKVFELELPAADPATLDNLTWDKKDLTALSHGLNADEPWLEGRVALGHLLRAAEELRESPRAVYERLARWAKVFELELPAVDPATLDNLTWDEDDRTVLSRDLDGERPWLEGRVTAGHLLQAAEELRESPRAVYERLARWAKVFELELPAVDPATLDSVTWDEKDLTALSHGLDGDEPWLEGRVTAGHLLEAAEELRESPRAVYERLARWAKVFELELPAVDPATLDNLTWDKKDLTALSHGLNAGEPWLQGPVSATHIRHASWLLGESEQEIRERLQRFHPAWIQLPPL